MTTLGSWENAFGGTDEIQGEMRRVEAERDSVASPRPWTLESDAEPGDRSGRTLTFRIVSQYDECGGAEVARLGPAHRAGMETGELYKNARLLAAAPELRDALSALYDACIAEEDGGVDEAGFMGAMKAAETALKRAKGGH